LQPQPPQYGIIKEKGNGGAEYETRNIYRHRIQLPEKEKPSERVSGNHDEIIPWTNGSR
jgi:hypothetical protein